jgi:hypothetical protein
VFLRAAARIASSIEPFLVSQVIGAGRAVLLRKHNEMHIGFATRAADVISTASNIHPGFFPLEVAMLQRKKVQQQRRYLLLCQRCARVPSVILG